MIAPTEAENAALDAVLGRPRYLDSAEHKAALVLLRGGGDSDLPRVRSFDVGSRAGEPRGYRICEGVLLQPRPARFDPPAGTKWVPVCTRSQLLGALEGQA